jgi:uncharacterized protein (TIGR03437 family)
MSPWLRVDNSERLYNLSLRRAHFFVIFAIAAGHLCAQGTAPAPLSIAPTPLPVGVVSAPYGPALLSATGGTPPYTWSLSAGGLAPTGLTLNPAGTFSGIPTTPGSATFGVQATDSASAVAAASFTIAIAPVPLALATPPTLPSGIAGAAYPAQVLTASGGVAPYTFAIAGSLPSGLAFSNGVITGTPASPGSFTFSLTVTDAASTTVSQPMQITVRPAGTDLLLGTTDIAFSLTTTSATPPNPIGIPILSSDHSQILHYSTAIAFPGVIWLNVSGGSTTPGAIVVSLTNEALSLEAGSYPAMIQVTCLAPSPCAGSQQTIGVSITVTALPPRLTVGPPLLAFSGNFASPGSASLDIIVQNTGGGVLTIDSVIAAVPWISVGPYPSSIPGGGEVSVVITADPTAGVVPLGVYQNSITVTSSAGTATVAVTGIISNANIMTLGPSGAQFNMIAGGAPGNPSGSFAVAISDNDAAPHSGNISASWTAAVVPGANWLVLKTTSGVATGSAPGTIDFSIDPAVAATLAPQAYYGTIRVTAEGILNSPQDFEVVLNVAPASSAPLPDPQPAGLVFVAPGAPVAAQKVQLFTSAPTAVPWQTAVTTQQGGAWLSVTPASGTASAGAPAQTSVEVNPAGLSAGVYRGAVNYALGVSVRAVSVTLIVEAAPLASAVSKSKPAPAAAPGCTPSQLIPTQTGLTGSFSSPASWPVPLSILLLDDCGNSVSSANVVATFSNGDSPLALSLVNSSSGLYSATWTPRNSTSQVSVLTQASAPGLPMVTIQIGGQVLPNAAPAMMPNGVVHIFNPSAGGALGPGTVVQIYGSNLAAQASTPNSVPLPIKLGGTSVIIGGIQAPLFYAGPGQINAQVPFELATLRQYQVIVSANGALSAPQQIQLGDVAPGIAQFPSSEIIAQHAADYTLVSSTSPAKPGETLIFYLAGMGLTNTAVATGAPSPGNPFAEPIDPPTLTVNGSNVTIGFDGLTPGSVGLYQVNFQVPANTPDGNAVLVLSQDGVPSNPVLLPVHQ